MTTNTTESLDDRILKMLEENTTHYERTCMFCGKNWLGLHCPHDGYQNPCPNCDRPPVAIDYFDCSCVGVTDLAEATTTLTQLIQQEVLRGSIKQLSDLIEIRELAVNQIVIADKILELQAELNTLLGGENNG